MLKRELMKYFDENTLLKENIECLVKENKEFRRKNNELLSISEI